ncbi:hypothetical protein MKX01_012270 [Papaver californicum]|nr:hypothetical protein MKX01_012270 [Papaver californicum]
MKPAADFGSSGRGRGKLNADGILEFKSKNLDAERKRRGKLKQKINDLRAAVPNITNMTKAATFDDAIAYIKGLKQQVDSLTNCLEQMEDTTVPRALDEEETEVQVELDDRNIVKFNIDRGIFTRLLELMTSLGFKIMDNNFTSFKGVCLTTLSVKVRSMHIFVFEFRRLKLK